MSIYLAGGAVRDLLLGKKIHDRDYLVAHCSKEEFLTIHPTAHQVGLNFPIFLVDNYEFSFQRSSSLEKDLELRDLTVNAMLLDDQGELLCHPRSLEDLHEKILRPASRQAFFDDPLRVYRAARFWAAMPSFTPHTELIEIMKEIASNDLLESIAPDRVGQEARKSLKTPMPGNFIRLLNQTGCLTPWFYELYQTDTIPAGPPQYHEHSILEHTCQIMDAVAGNEQLVWMALCHDLGKKTTYTHKLPHHYGHDQRGIECAEQLAQRIHLPKTFEKIGAQAAQWHMIAGQYDQLRPATRVDLLYDLHKTDITNEFFQLVAQDQKKDFIEQALHDTQIILSVKLPSDKMNCGPQSGILLRQLRAAALKEATK